MTFRYLHLIYTRYNILFSFAHALSANIANIGFLYGVVGSWIIHFLALYYQTKNALFTVRVGVTVYFFV